MKTLILILTFIGFNLITNPSIAQEEFSMEEPSPIETVSFDIYGKAGAILNGDGSYKLCPGWAFYRCATIEISLKDIWNMIFKPNPTGGDEPIPITIEIYDEQQQVIDRIMTDATIPFPDRFHSVEDIRAITSNDIIIK
jgi:hypothetical protein